MVIVLVVVDLFRGAIFLGVSVCHRMAVITISLDLEQGGLLGLAGAFNGNVGTGAHLVNVFPEKNIPSDVVSFGALSQRVFVGGGTLLARTHGVTIVLDNGNDPQLQQDSQSQ